MTLSNEQLADHIAALDWSGTSLQHQLAMSAAVAVLRGRLEEPPENPIGDLIDLLASSVNRC
jgi:hypothetical protein